MKQLQEKILTLQEKITTDNYITIDHKYPGQIIIKKSIMINQLYINGYGITPFPAINIKKLEAEIEQYPELYHKIIRAIDMFKPREKTITDLKLEIIYNMLQQFKPLIHTRDGYRIMTTKLSWWGRNMSFNSEKYTYLYLRDGIITNGHESIDYRDMNTLSEISNDFNRFIKLLQKQIKQAPKILKKREKAKQKLVRLNETLVKKKPIRYCPFCGKLTSECEC